MKSIQLFFVAALLLLGVQCKKENPITANAHFYSMDEAKEQTQYLFIDDAAYGLLPKLLHEPDCADTNSEQSALSFPLKSGRYKIVVKDSLGKVYNESHLTFSENKTEAGGTRGSMKVNLSNDHCLRVGLGSAQ